MSEPSMMLKEVAIAIARASEDDFNYGLHWAMNPDNRQRCFKLAHAAVEAMREPTSDMLKALLADKFLNDSQHNRDIFTLDWLVMIDSILKGAC